MLAKIKQVFRGFQFVYIPLVFQLDLDESGKHIARVCKQIGESRYPVTDIERLWTYGYREEIESPYRVGVLRDDDRQTLYALKSLNPTVHADGRLVFEVTPNILAYLRTKANVEESEPSRTLQMTENIARLTARFQYNAATGIRIEAGYTFADDVLISATQLEKTADGAHFKVGSTFWRAPGTVSPMAQQLLQDGLRLIAPDEIPDFLQKDLPTIKREFRTILSEEAGRVQVLTTRLVPVVKVLSVVSQSSNADGMVAIEIEYRGAGLVIRHRDLYPNIQHGYYRCNPTTWVVVDLEMVSRIQLKLGELGAVTTPDRYELRPRQFIWLKELVNSLANPGSPTATSSAASVDRKTNATPTPARASATPRDRFVEIVSGGQQERRVPAVRVSVQYETPGISFLKEAQRLRSREESSADPVPFMQYWPTYSSMNSQQLRWYLYWRAQVRRGRFLPTDLSYVFVHIYELLNLVELPDVTQAAARLKVLWHAYRPQHPKLDNYLPDWGGDLLAYKSGIDAAMAWWEQSALLSDRLSPLVANVLIHFYVQAQQTGAMPYRLWANLTAYRPRNKFYQEYNTDGRLDRAYEQAIRTAEEYWQRTVQQSLLEKFTSAKLHPMRKPLFASAVIGYLHPDSIDLGLSRDYHGDVHVNDHLTAVVKYAENLLRKQERFPRKLSGIKLDPSLAQVLESVFTPAPPPPAPYRISIDQARVAAIIKQTEQIGAILEPAQVEEKESVPSKVLYTDLAEMRQLWAGLDVPYRLALTALFQKKITTIDQLAAQLASNAILPNLLIDRVNEQAIKLLGDCLIYQENGSTLTLAEDFLDELDLVVKESPPEVAPAVASHTTTGGPWDEVFARLTPAEIALIRLFAETDGLTDSEIEAATRPYYVMANAALDGLNEKASDGLGHPPLYLDGEKWFVEEDDWNSLRQHLSAPETN